MSSSRVASVDDLRERFGAGVDLIGTPQASDALDTLSLTNQSIVGSITPLRKGMWAFGPAATVEFAPDETMPDDDPYGDAIRFIDGLAAGSVAVVASSSPDRSALWGELFTAAAKGRGAVGVLTNGRTRDTEKVLALDLPVFGDGFHNSDFKGRQRVVSMGEPVSMNGVVIRPEDWILADNDGVVVVPAQSLDACIEAAVNRLTGESTVLEELLDGDTLRGVWERHRLL
ncbi:MAG: RraA family protein [Actinomycetota bacterium]